ncbi:MAG: hypothetical protein AAF628_32500 [Planctomycetota bacterium]
MSSSASLFTRWLSTPVDVDVEARSARPPASSGEWLRFALTVAQRVLVAWVIDRWQIESRAFSRVFTLAAGGAVVHALLPLRFRMAFFVMLSGAGLVSVLGSRNAAVVIAVGLIFLGLCYAPVRTPVKVAALAIAGTVLTLLRADVVSAPWSSALWPVIGSLLMFRVAIFIYDLSHKIKPRSIWEALAYFFMLPNVAMVLFPVVDFATFRKTYYAENAWQCCQTGLRWIVRGVVQLILYRLMYYHGVLAPDEVSGAGDIFRYVVTTFGLYFRVSGIFHVAIGILRLFGFGLPETHFLYWLSSSVNDFWRRVNIYWKDFMLKLFYLPAFFRLRKQGQTRAFVLATAWVVFCTWWLHSYQWFWLRGSFPVKWQDGLFWCLIGLFMVWNTLYEQRKSAARGRRAAAQGLQALLVRTGGVLVTFTFIALLWSVWTCESAEVWLGMWTTIGSDTPPATPPAVAWAMVVTVLVILVGGAAVGHRLTDSAAGGNKTGAFVTNAVTTIGGSVLLLVLSTSWLHAQLPQAASEVMQSLRVARLNRLDAEQLTRGYYEDLLDVDRFNSELWNAFKSKPRDWVNLDQTAAIEPSGDFALTQLKPDIEIEYHGATLRTNQFGLRDRRYEEQKPDDTWRAALVGASYVMGSGVGNDETFENLVEDGLTADPPPGGLARYEILNFAVAGYGPLQRVWSFEHRATRFSPDVVLYVAHENEVYRVKRHLASAWNRGVPLPFPELEAIYAEAGITKGMAAEAFENALEPHVRKIIEFSYRRLGEAARAAGARPAWVLLPTLEMSGDREELGWLVDLARDAGLEAIELFGVYDGHHIFDIRLADWDYHPNVDGHRIIADRLLAELRSRPALLRRP